MFASQSMRQNLSTYYELQNFSVKFRASIKLFLKKVILTLLALFSDRDGYDAIKLPWSVF